VYHRLLRDGRAGRHSPGGEEGGMRERSEKKEVGLVWRGGSVT